MNDPWAVIVSIVIAGIGVTLVALMCRRIIRNEPKRQLLSHLQRIENTCKSELKELQKQLYIRVRQIGQHALPDNYLVHARNGELIEVRLLLLRYGKKVCEQRIARQHLEKLRNGCYNKEADSLRKSTYATLLAADIDPYSQFADVVFVRDPERAEELVEVFRSVLNEFKYNS